MMVAGRTLDAALLENVAIDTMKAGGQSVIMVSCEQLLASVI